MGRFYFQRWILMGLAASGFGAVSRADGVTDRVSGLLERINNSGEEQSREAMGELVGLGEDGINAIDEIVRRPGAHERDWELYIEAAGKVRAFTPVTIHAENANASEVIQEMGRQSGIWINGENNWPKLVLSQMKVSVDAKGEPAWEALRGAMGELKMKVESDGSIRRRTAEPMPDWMLGGDWMFLDRVRREADYDYQRNRASGTTLTLDFSTYPDPLRSNYLQKEQIWIESAKDDAGGVYQLKHKPYVSETYVNTTEISFPIDLTGGSKGARTLTVRGSQALYGGPTEVRGIEASKLEGQTVDVGSAKLKVVKVKTKPGFGITISVKPEDWKYVSAEAGMMGIERLCESWIFAENEKGRKYRLHADFREGLREEGLIELSTGTVEGQEPKVVFAIPRELKPIHIPFLIKDIPLP